MPLLPIICLDQWYGAYNAPCVREQIEESEEIVPASETDLIISIITQAILVVFKGDAIDECEG